ncbi:MAG: guanylate kinase [Muribaculaceae bacterium]|jgi:guanylate kinase|nr:guanylate kinase [Muribaculaceae bacterium]MEE1338145.1 guanylate kinase [Muribaculaceae bacterium]
MAKGKLIIISAPSGCGKSTIIGEIIKNEGLNLAFSISATTRAPRGEEIDGVNYYFLSEDEFKQAIANDELVEYEEVYPGRYYGTLKKEIARICESGKNVILDIDVKGGINVKKKYGAEALSIFIMPPSVEVLRERLISRATDTAEAIAERVGKAEYEISFAGEFDCRVVNDKLDVAVKETEQIITDFVL